MVDFLLITDPYEISLILEHRKKVAWAKELHEKQEACDHDWHYDGKTHNDDVYGCRRCNLTKFV